MADGDGPELGLLSDRDRLRQFCFRSKEIDTGLLAGSESVPRPMRSLAASQLMRVTSFTC